MQSKMGILLFFALVSGISPSPPADLENSVILTPLIRFKSNFTFFIATGNKSPTESFHLNFDIIDLASNVSLSTFQSKLIPPDQNGKRWEEVTLLPPPNNISLRPLALRTRVFRLPKNISSPPHLEDESTVSLQANLQNSFIHVTLNRPQYSYAQGDKVYFSILLLDRNFRVFDSSKNLSISIWKKHPEHFLMKHWPSVEIRPNHPFVTGQFRIPQTFYSNFEQEEEFQILVTVDERDLDDPTILEGLTIPIHYEFLRLGSSLFDSKNALPQYYSSSSTSIFTRPNPRYKSFSKKSTQFKAKIVNPYVGLQEGKFRLEVNATNEYGQPVKSGYCTIKQESSTHHCLVHKQEFNESFLEGRISSEINFVKKDEVNCKESSEYELLKTLSSELTLNCVDEASKAGWRKKLIATLMQTEFVIDFIHPVEDTVIFKVTRRDGLTLGQVTTKLHLKLSYILKNGTSFDFSESLVEEGYVEHKMKVNCSELKKLTASFGDALFSTTFLGNETRFSEKEDNGNREKRPFLWKTWALNCTSLSFEIEGIPRLPIVSVHPLEAPVLVRASLFEYTRATEPGPGLFTPQIVESLKYLTFINLTSVEHRLPLYASASTSRFIHVHLDFGYQGSHEDKNQISVRYKPPPSADFMSLGNNTISISFPESKGPLNLFVVNIEDTYNCGEFVSINSDIREASARLHLEDEEKEWVAGDLILSSTNLTQPKQLSVTAKIPPGLTPQTKINGILVEGKHGARKTQMTTFDSKPTLTIETEIKDKKHPEIQTVTIFNNSNKTLSQVELFVDDLNKVIVFRKTSGGFSHDLKKTLEFEVPPFSRKQTELKFYSAKVGVANLRLLASVNGNQATTISRFHISPNEHHVIDSFPVFINNVNTSDSNFTFSWPSAHSKNRTNMTSFRLDVDFSFNFINAWSHRLLRYREHEKNFLLSLLQVTMTLDQFEIVGLMTPVQRKLLLQVKVEELIQKIPTNFTIDDPEYLSPEILHVFLKLKTPQGRLHTHLLERTVDLVLQKFEDNWRISFAQNQSDSSENSTFKRVSYLLALQAAMENTSRRPQIANILEEEVDTLSNQFQNSFKLVDVLAITHLLDELNHPQADDSFAHAQFLASTSNSPIGKGFYIHEAPNEIATDQVALETSLALLCYLKRVDIHESYRLALRLARVVENLTPDTPEPFMLKTLTSFAQKYSYATFYNDQIQVDVAGNPDENFTLRATGRGRALAVVVLSSFTMPT